MIVLATAASFLIGGIALFLLLAALAAVKLFGDSRPHS